ncbi:putative Xaa-Pro aminopeptidase P, partial [Pluteus cervinus]
AFLRSPRCSALHTMGGGSHTVNTAERLQALREQLSKNTVNAFVVPSEDQHSSEYLASCDERRAFISGFNGSAGCAIVTETDAFLFTDGRYFLQAEQQLDKNWTLMKQGLPDVPTWQEFLSKRLEKAKIGIDATLISASDAETLTKSLAPKESELVSLPHNIVDQVWKDRPARPANSVFHLDVKYAGQSHQEKIEKVREELKKEKRKAFVVTMLDEVAWLFNLRGSDIDFNPVFFAYAVVTLDKVTLFINRAQLHDEAVNTLGDTVDIQPYDAFFDYLRTLPDTLELSSDSKALIGKKASLAVADALGKDRYIIDRSIVADLKTIKNGVELEGFRQSHIRDGAALARYFAWLEEQLNDGVVLDECQGADQLEKYRSELDLFKGLSFPTISSSGPNGAIIHYQPTRGDCAVIKKDQIYLCDSGAQFLDGTTDVTRTWHFGTPTDEEKRAFTRVLQGHIAIDAAIFPTGTTVLTRSSDSWARRPLWQDGLGKQSPSCFSSCHGTGHGVGHFLNVHEGPQAIGIQIAYNSTPLKPGMTVSNEPGFYADGRFGIRIENIVLVREASPPNNFGNKGYLGFEHVTLSPVHKKLIDTSLLTGQEKQWINDYHAETWEKVSPLLKNDPRALEWLKRETSPL